jgi:hypothetical protein
MIKDILLNGDYYLAFIKSQVITKSYLPMKLNQGHWLATKKYFIVSNVHVVSKFKMFCCFSFSIAAFFTSIKLFPDIIL